MKFNVTTFLGFFTILIASVVLITDMYYSLNEAYHFELKGWHVFAGYFSGVAMVILPEEKLIHFVERVINKKIRY